VTSPPVIRLEGPYVPWTHAVAVGESGGATASARGTAWLDGRLLAGDDLAARVREIAGAAFPEQRVADLLGLCRKLDGAWAFVVGWPDGETLAAVDRLRTIPLFYGRLDGGRFVIGDSAAALGDCTDARAIDHEAAVELLLSGCVMGSRTIRRGVFLVQPGEVVHWKGGEVGADRHYRFLPTELSAAGSASLTETLDATMDAVFARLARQFAGQRIIVPLSGGLDSRLIVAMLKRHGHRDLLALTYGRPGSPDVETSRAVADALGIAWTFIPYVNGEWHRVMDTPAMRAFWEYAGQGAALPHLQDYLALQQLRRLDPGLEAVFFAGVVGDMIAGAWTPSSRLFRVASTRRPRQVEAADGPVDLAIVCDWLVSSKYDLWPARKDEVEAIERRIRSFFADVTFTEADSSASAFDLFEFENRQARYLANSVRAYESHGFGWWLPLCDDALMDFFLTVPTDLRTLKRLYAEWMRSRVFVDRMARLAEIPPIGDGRPMWYGEERPGRRTLLLERARAVARVARSAEPRMVRDVRFRWALKEYRSSDLRFDEWFAVDAAGARSTKLRTLMRASDGPLAGLPRELADRFGSREDYPLCFVAPLALLGAAYLAAAFRAKGRGG
jgi:asparagine synthase (glutamine-hydrolysing)